MLIHRTFRRNFLDHRVGTGGLTVDERNQTVAFATAVGLLGAGIYAGLRGHFFLGGMIAISAPLVAGAIRAQGTKEKTS